MERSSLEDNLSATHLNARHSTRASNIIFEKSEKNVSDFSNTGGATSTPPPFSRVVLVSTFLPVLEVP